MEHAKRMVTEESLPHTDTASLRKHVWMSETNEKACVFGSFWPPTICLFLPETHEQCLQTHQNQGG